MLSDKTRIAAIEQEEVDEDEDEGESEEEEEDEGEEEEDDDDDESDELAEGRSYTHLGQLRHYHLPWYIYRQYSLFTVRHV